MKDEDQWHAKKSKKRDETNLRSSLRSNEWEGLVEGATSGRDSCIIWGYDMKAMSFGIYKGRDYTHSLKTMLSYSHESMIINSMCLLS